MIVASSASGLALLALLGGLLERVELNVPGRVVAVVPADVDGDGQRDVLVFWRQGAPPSRGRVSIYPARAGRIVAKPVQVASLPPATAAFDVGDATGDGRADVLLLTGDGISCLAGRAGGRLAKQPLALVRAMTMAAHPHEDHVPRMALLAQLGRAGRKALMIPTVPIGPLALYELGDDGAYALRGMLRVPTRGNLHTSAEDFRSARNYGAAFHLVIPRLRVGDCDGDGRADLFFFERDSVAVFCAGQGGSYPARPSVRLRFSLLSEQERIRRGSQLRGDTADFNGDGRTDLVFNKATGGIANMRNKLWVFLARGRCGYRRQPDLRIGSEGFGGSVRAVDVDRDGRADLVRPYVKMGIMAMTQVLLTRKLGVQFLVHFSRDGLPGKRPDFSLKSSLAVNFDSNQELTGPYPIFGEDFTGDGKPDVVLGQAGAGSGANPDRLEILGGLGPGSYDSTPLWSIDLPATRYLLPFRIGPDDPPGLLVYFPLVDGREGDVWVLRNTRTKKPT